ncbi:RsmE family RNA methyltransferase, partial [Francisella tularensis]|uniref:RsmE family RNA methyltransferase n=1 Tax=Francisella tularensis TaxID=263 RepID=UPI001C0EBE08
ARTLQGDTSRRRAYGSCVFFITIRVPHVATRALSSAASDVYKRQEGGFSDKEMSKFHSNNFYTINLGKRILKAETAPINILSIINFLKQ